MQCSGVGREVEVIVIVGGDDGSVDGEDSGGGEVDECGQHFQRGTF